MTVLRREGLDMTLDYWDGFYDGRDSRRVPVESSAFALQVESLLPPGRPVIDLGTGTGRDALYFAEQGRRVLGLDFSPSAIERLRRGQHARFSSARFEVLDVADTSDVSRLATTLAAAEPHALYARFFLHAIHDDARRGFWALAGAVTRAGGDSWLEFRVSDDLQPAHEFGDHFRCPLTVEQVLQEAQSAGLCVANCEVGHGMAVYLDEDPLVARLHLTGSPLRPTGAVNRGVRRGAVAPALAPPAC